jgi:uncharacterized membrane protein YgcG
LYQYDQREALPELDITPPARQRRLTVLLRLLLLIPQFIVMALLGIVTFFAAIVAWFAALALGRLPGWAESYLSGYVAYTTRVYASLYLLVDRYPPFGFTAPRSPVQVELHPGRLNRLAVLFRIILVIPAGIIGAVLAAGWQALSFFCWLVVLVLGRTPAPLFEATAAVLRYNMRLQAYFLMLTAAYPKRIFGDPGTAQAAPGGVPGSAAPGSAAPGGASWAPDDAGPFAAAGGAPGSVGDAAPSGSFGAAGSSGSSDSSGGGPGRGSATRPLLLTGGAKVLLAVFIVFGLLGIALPSGESGSSSSNSGTTAHAQAVRPPALPAAHRR